MKKLFIWSVQLALALFTCTSAHAASANMRANDDGTVLWPPNFFTANHIPNNTDLATAQAAATTAATTAALAAGQQYASNAAANIVVQGNLQSGAQVSQSIQSSAVIALPGYVVVQSGPTNFWTFTNLDRAIAQFQQPADKFTPSGGRISIGPGLFTFTSRFLYTNNQVGSLEISGAGMNATVLRYAGSEVGSIFTVMGGPTNDDNIDFNCHDLSIYSMTNMLAPCFTLRNCNYFFEKVSMGSWRAMVENGLDNTTTGHGKGYLGIQKDILNPAAEKPALIGIVDLGSQGNLHDITHCYFVNCADAIYFTSDHGLIERDVFQACGAWLSNTVVIKETAWPTTSKYCLGADIIMDGSSYVPSLGDIHCLFNVHYRARTGYVSFYGNRYPVAMNEYFENCDYSGVGGGGNLTFLNTSESGSPTPSPGQLSGPPYVITTPPDGRIMSMGFDATSYDSGTALFVGSVFGVHRDGALNATSIGAGSFQSDSFANGGNRYLAVDDDGNFSATTDGSSWNNMHFIKGISGSGFTVTYAANADGSSNATITVTGGGGAPTLAQLYPYLYGGTPTITGLAEAAGGLVLSHTLIGKPTDSDFLLSFNTSSVAQAALTNLFRVDLSAAISTNFVVPSYNMAAYGAFTNTGTGAAVASVKFWMVPNSSSPSNSFFIMCGAQAMNTASTFTIAVHVGRP